MKADFFIIFLTILFLAVTMVYTDAMFFAAEEYASLASSTQAVEPNLAVANGLISLDLRDIEVKDALKFLATKANLSIVPGNDVSGRVTLMISNAPIEDVFEILIRSNDLAYEKVGSIYNVMTEKEYSRRYGRKFDDIRQLKVFHLKYVVPGQAYMIINSIKSSIGKVLVENDSGSILVLDTPEKIKQIAEALDGLERKSSVRIFNLHYAKAKDIEKQLKTQIDLKKIGLVKADERTNQIIVQTLPERMIDVEKIIRGLDQKTKEVLIDARIIQIKLSDNLSQGVQWEGLFNLSKEGSSATSYLGTYPVSSVAKVTDDWRSRQEVLADTEYVGSYPFSGTTSNFSSGTKKVVSEQMHIGVVGKNDYDVLINYLETVGDVKILSNPKLVVTNNQEARIHVGERQAYITTTTTAGQTTTTVSEEVTFLDVGLQLFITPTINDDRFITLSIKPDLSSVIGTLVTAQNNEIPIIDTSTAETTVMVKDGATVAIGGLHREERSVSSRRTPILGKIPFLGMFFKSDSKENSRSELLLMVTAHIIEGDELVTGNTDLFGRKYDQQYQGYNLITAESDLTEYEKEEGKIIQKSYQQYPEYRKEEEYHPAIKPLKYE